MTPEKNLVPRLIVQYEFGEPTAGRTGASVASLERLLVSSLAKVVGTGVGDHGALRHYISTQSPCKYPSLDLRQ